MCLQKPGRTGHYKSCLARPLPAHSAALCGITCSLSQVCGQWLRHAVLPISFVQCRGVHLSRTSMLEWESLPFTVVHARQSEKSSRDDGNTTDVNRKAKQLPLQYKAIQRYSGVLEKAQNLNQRTRHKLWFCHTLAEETPGKLHNLSESLFKLLKSSLTFSPL